MKILYIITKSNYGGAQRYVFEVAGAMKARGHDVAVACGGNGLLTEKLREAGISVYSIKSFARDINVTKEIRSVFELISILRTFRPDIVHLNSSKAGGTGAFVSRILGVKKIVFTAHGWPFREDRSVLWKTLVYIASCATALLSHTVIAVSKNDARAMTLPFLTKKVITIHTSVGDIHFKDRDTARHALLDEETVASHAHDVWLATNAELTSNKNLSSSIDAVIRYNETHAQKIFYTIMGDGELYETLAREIEERHATAYIKLLGYVNGSRDYLLAFDLFTLPSKKEGLPYAILEAASAGLPVIASNTGGIPEVIEHEKNGLLIDPNHSESIVAALEVLIQNPEIRVLYGDALKKYVHEHYALRTMLDATQRIYTTQ